MVPQQILVWIRRLTAIPLVLLRTEQCWVVFLLHKTHCIDSKDQTRVDGSEQRRFHHWATGLSSNKKRIEKVAVQRNIGIKRKECLFGIPHFCASANKSRKVLYTVHSSVALGSSGVTAGGRLASGHASFFFPSLAHVFGRGGRPDCWAMCYARFGFSAVRRTL